MKPMKLGPEDILFYVSILYKPIINNINLKEGDIDDSSIYLIESGEIELFNLKDNSTELLN